MTIFEKKITNRGAAGRFFLVWGVRMTIFVVPESGGIGRDRAAALVCEHPCPDTVPEGAG